MSQPRPAQELLSNLTRVARRWRRVRVRECAAVGAVAAAFCCAVLQAGWALAPRANWCGWALGGGLVLAGVAIAAVRPLAQVLTVRRSQRWLAAGVFAVLGAAGGAALLTGTSHTIAPWALVCTCLLGGAAAGATMAALQPMDLQALAELLDERCGLSERLTTAVELTRQDGPDDPATACVCRQAAMALAHARQRPLPLADRTRATAAAVALTALLCLALLALPAAALEDRLADRLDALGPEQQAALQAALQAAARKAAGNRESAGLLRQAAEAVAVRDEEAFRRLAARLAELGHPLRKVVGADVLTRALASADGGGGQGSGASGTSADTPDTSPAAPAAPKAPSTDPVRVYDPAYAHAVGAGGSPRKASDSGKGLVRIEDSWRDARTRAGEALSTGRVPPAYREIVRAFFLDED